MFKVLLLLHPGHQPLVHPFSNPEDSVKPFTANPRTPRFSKGKQSSSSEAAWALVPRELEETGRGRGKRTETLDQKVSHFLLSAAAMTRNKVFSQQVIRMKWGRSIWNIVNVHKGSSFPSTEKWET